MDKKDDGGKSLVAEMFSAENAAVDDETSESM
jgi:hypothetical protein